MGVNMVQAVKEIDFRTYEFLFHYYIVAIALLTLLDDIPILSEATHTYTIQFIRIGLVHDTSLMTAGHGTEATHRTPWLLPHYDYSHRWLWDALHIAVRV